MKGRSSLGPAAALINVKYCSVTGNVLLNEFKEDEQSGKGPYSLVAVIPAETVAITGNVCRGQLQVPERSVPPNLTQPPKALQQLVVVVQ